MADSADDDGTEASSADLEVYAVFAQRPDARIDIDAWNAHAERFFATRIGLAEEPRDPAGVAPPRTARAAFVVAPAVAPGIRVARARPTREDDWALAARADGAGTGLALLARRCPTIWLVSREGEPDALALRFAAILASVLLGPILDRRRVELFGAKTARAKLAELALG